MNNSLDSEDIASVVDEVKEEIRNYLKEHYGNDLLSREFSSNWIYENITDIETEAYQIATDFLDDRYEITDNLGLYVDQLMNYINVVDILEDIIPWIPMMLEDKLKEVGMSYKDFL
jgi:trehalose-6-phosphatase